MCRFCKESRGGGLMMMIVTGCDDKVLSLGPSVGQVSLNAVKRGSRKDCYTRHIISYHTWVHNTTVVQQTKIIIGKHYGQT
jgi:hypothetical protein